MLRAAEREKMNPGWKTLQEKSELHNKQYKWRIKDISKFLYLDNQVNDGIYAIVRKPKKWV